MRPKRGAGVALVLACGLAFPAAAALGPGYGGALRIGALALPDGTSPGPAGSSGARLLAALAHETLLGLDDDARPVAGLASGWTGAAGSREWTLELSPWARFQDDRPVTALDAVRSLRRFLRSDSIAGAVLAERLDGGAAFRAGDRSALPGMSLSGARLTLRLRHAYLAPLAPLASPAAAVTDGAGRGCGPFVPTIAVPGERFELVGFASHVRGRPYLDRVIVRRIDSREAGGALVAGGRLEAGEASAGLASHAALLLLVLDPLQAPFDDEHIRRHVAGAIDRESLARHFWPELLPLAAPAGRPGPGSPPLSSAITLAVAADVPRLASRRVVAHLTALGLEVTAAPHAPGRRSTAAARLLLWAPEVAEPGLALRELASLAPMPGAVQRDLRAAEDATDPEERSARLETARRALDAHAAVIALGRAPTAFAIGGRLRGARLRGASLLVEDAWLAP